MLKLTALLRFQRLRFYFVKLRYLALKKSLKLYGQGSSSVGENTIEHNLSALEVDAGFGCGGRMGLLILPIVGFYSFYTIDRANLEVLMVGCRTEDDIFWMKSYGFCRAKGLDLISYSKYVLLGDIHQTSFADASLDVVVLGWMISYSSDPGTVIRECRRILKPGGLLGLGIEHDPSQEADIVVAPRVNSLNCADDITELLASVMGFKIVFSYDHFNDGLGDYSCAVIARRD